jgi:DNA polymerase III epsilon subunit-like protein
VFQQATNDIIYPPKEERLPRGTKNCLVISYDLETTGLSSDDEIIQIGAYTHIPPTCNPSDFSQFIWPATKKIHPEAAAKIGLEVRGHNLYDSR